MEIVTVDPNNKGNWLQQLIADGIDTDNMMICVLGAIAVITILTPVADRSIVGNIVSGMIGYLGASGKNPKLPIAGMK